MMRNAIVCSCLVLAIAFAEPPRRSYTIQQATSDRAQLHTIAFNGLAFLTSDFAQCTFIPPGKVCDYFGFQFMRDNDKAELGHNTSFLTRIANNTFAILTDAQRRELIDLARRQEKDLELLALQRLVLIDAFVRLRDGKLPAAARSLDREAIMAYTGEIFELDGKLSLERAKVMGAIARTLSDEQKRRFAQLAFDDSRTWGEIESPVDKRAMSHTAHVAAMTYASEFFSWYAGNVEADTYFCPERHGTYFGGFFVKDAPAMGKKNYSISTRLTGESGAAFLEILTLPQRKLIDDISDDQRADLSKIVEVRRSIATEFRKLMTQPTTDDKHVLDLAREYGRRDGALAHLYATRFAQVARDLTDTQRKHLAELRDLDQPAPKAAYLYSTPIDLPALRASDFLFSK